MKRLLFLLLISISYFTVQAQPLFKDEASGLYYLLKKGDPKKPTVVLLHGYGSNERDLFSFANVFPEGTNIICARGPISYSSSSFAWYDIQFRNDGNHQRNIDQAYASVEKITGFLQSVLKNNGLTGKIILGGFSQGAIMSLYLAINQPTLMNGIIGMSGTLLEENLKPISANKKQYETLKVYYAHGTNDQLLPITHGRKCKQLIDDAEMQLSYYEYPITHTISQQEVKDMVEWFNTNF